MAEQSNPAPSAPIDPAAAPASSASPTPEPAAAAAPATQDPDLSSRFAALARKEKLLVDRERKALELEKKFGKYGQVKPKENPLAWLETGELTLEELIQAKLKEGKPPTAEDKFLTVEEKLKNLEKQLADKEEQSKQEHINRSVNEFKQKIKAYVESDKAKFELIAAHDALDDVYATCEQYWEAQVDVEPSNRKSLPIEKAAELVENHLYESAKKYLSVSKYKSLFMPSEPTKETDPKAADTPGLNAKPTEKTLTNRGSTPSVGGSKLLPREIAIRQIAAQFDRK